MLPSLENSRLYATCCTQTLLNRLFVLQVLPALGTIPSEAPLNLVIHHLRAGRVEDANALVQDINPTTPHEYILKVRGRFCLRMLSLVVRKSTQNL